MVHLPINNGSFSGTILTAGEEAHDGNDLKEQRILDQF